MIIFETTLYKDVALVIGESPTNDADRTDFINNFQADAKSVDEFILPDRDKLVVVDWTELKTKFSDGSELFYIESADKFTIVFEEHPTFVSRNLQNGGSSDLNVDGSVTPVIFSASPPTGKKWFIHSVTLIMEDESINFTKFGGISGGLTNGIEFRIKEGGEAEKTLGTFKTNGDLHTFTTDIRLDSAATDLLTLQENVQQIAGTTFELKNADSDVFKVIVNDNLTSIKRFNFLIKGFEVNE